MKKYSIKYLFLFVILLNFSQTSFAKNKSDKKVIKQLKENIEYLASDALEGRRTATIGEKKAADYLIAQYNKSKIAPYKGHYKHPFDFVYGKQIEPSSQLKIGNDFIKLNEGFFPLPFSSNTSNKIKSEVLPDVFEHGSIWLISLYNDKDEANDAHFDYEKTMYEKAKNAKQQGAIGILFYDDFNAKYPPVFNRHSEFDVLDIPIAFLTYNAFEKEVKNKSTGVTLEMNIAIEKPKKNGTNVAAYIDNKAPYTVIIGGHYDHLGYGEDGNSMYTGKDKQIHNGADDNASGTAGVIEIANRVKKNKLHHYNYLFVNFSGEELGLLGSKAFVKNEGIDSNKIAYMINMDMVGRLNDSTHALTIGGVGTSPVWGRFISKTNDEFKIVIDSSGVGPSDHTSFYYADIPVLFFFTGLHHDYHKPSDDADKINYYGEARVLNYVYNIIDEMDKMPKPKFTKTKQAAVGKVRFKVTLGIMPDYSYAEENGIRVDGVSDDRPAMIAGIKAGDIITQLGNNKVNGMQSYMEALSKFNVGDKTEVTVLRDNKMLQLELIFK
jgi:hypothetical protein